MKERRAMKDYIKLYKEVLDSSHPTKKEMILSHKIYKDWLKSSFADQDTLLE